MNANMPFGAIFINFSHSFCRSDFVIYEKFATTTNGAVVHTLSNVSMNTRQWTDAMKGVKRE
jgi:hypothetical protein